MAETTHARIAIGGVPRPSRRSGCSPAIISGPGGGGWSVKKTANNSFDKISNYQSVKACKESKRPYSLLTPWGGHHVGASRQVRRLLSSQHRQTGQERPGPRRPPHS